MGRNTSNVILSSEIFFSNLVSAIHLLRDSQLTRLVLGGEFPDIGLGGILSEGSKSVSDLSHLDFAIAPVVKQLESLLEFWNEWISFFKEILINKEKQWQTNN